MVIDETLKLDIAKEVAKRTETPVEFVLDDIESMPDWQEWLEDLLSDGRERAIDSLCYSIERRWQEFRREEIEKLTRETLWVIEECFARRGLKHSNGGLWFKPDCEQLGHVIVLTDYADPPEHRAVISIYVGEDNPKWADFVVDPEFSLEGKIEVAKKAIERLDAVCNGECGCDD